MSKEFGSPERVARFYRHNLLDLLVTAEIWVVLYCLWMNLYGGVEVSIGSYLRYALFIEMVPFAHWWYIPTILSIYVVVPLISSGIATLSGDDGKVHLAIKVALGFSLFANFIIPSYSRFAPLLGLPSVGTQLVGSVLGPYLAYIIAGFLILHKKVLQGIPATILSTLAALSSACAVIEGYLAGDLWYDSLFLLTASAALAELSRRLMSGLSGNSVPATRLLSACSFGVFLVHMPVRDMIGPQLGAFPGAAGAVLLFLAVAVLSFAIALSVWFATSPVAWLRRALLDA